MVKPLSRDERRRGSLDGTEYEEVCITGLGWRELSGSRDAGTKGRLPENTGAGMPGFGSLYRFTRPRLGFWRPRPDLNRDKRFRKPLLYPVELRGRRAKREAPGKSPGFP